MTKEEDPSTAATTTISPKKEESAPDAADAADVDAPPTPVTPGKDVQSETSSAAAKAATANDPAIERKWDRTNRKVIVSNVMKYLRKNEVPRLVSSLLRGAEDSIKVAVTRKPPKLNFMRLTLEHEDMVELFLRKFGEEVRRNKKGGIMEAHRATLDRGRGEDSRGGGGGNKRGRDGDDDEGAKRARMDAAAKPLTPSEVRDAILGPMWTKPYGQQLLSKYREMSRKSCIPIVKSVKKKFRDLEKEARHGRRGRPPAQYPWLDRQMKIDDVLGSGKVLGYRNKVELTFGYKEVEGEGGDKEGKTEAEGKKDDKDAKMEEDDDKKKEDEGDRGKDAGEKEKNDKEGGDKKEEKEKEAKKIPALGFLPRGWRHSVASPHHLPNVPRHFCSVASTIDTFLSTSPVPPYNSKVHRGVWRTCTMRSSRRTGEIMAVITHAPPGGSVGKRDCGSDDYTKVWEEERDRLVEMLKECEVDAADVDAAEYPTLLGDEAVKAGGRGKIVDKKYTEGEEPPVADKMKITSIFFQEFDGLSNPKPDHPVQHMFGKTHITEQLGQCSFRISPGAFFQVTTEGAEVLYDVVVDKVKEAAGDKGDKALLLDVCCGTGTIGLYCMKEGAGGRVLGVDIAEPAIKDAKVNAAENGYADEKEGIAKFVAGRAEKVLSREIYRLERDPANKNIPIIAIVDPAREGLHGDVVKALRSCDKIDRLVYVSCNPTKSLVNDAQLLCSPPTKKYGGIPFEPTSATPVDMFPLTGHCEMVMTFDRLKKDTEEEEVKKKEEKEKDGSEEEKKEKENEGKGDKCDVEKEKAGAGKKNEVKVAESDVKQERKGAGKKNKVKAAESDVKKERKGESLKKERVGESGGEGGGSGGKGVRDEERS